MAHRIAMTVVLLWLNAGVAQGASRVEFEDRLIKGQTAKTGAIQIYRRQPVEIRSLLRAKRSFLQRAIRQVFERD